MKSANIPSLRVDPKLRDAAQSVLEDGESLSSFMEQALRLNIERRRVQREFIARGLEARAQAKQAGKYIPAEVVLLELDRMLSKATAKRNSRK